MTRLRSFGLAMTAVLSAAGCGDNTNVCGPGTTDLDGVCTAGSGGTCGPGTKADATGACVPDGSTVCGAGTTLDGSGQCTIDPTACQDGTVLVGSECVAPGHVAVTVEESPEPNGMGVAVATGASEPSAAPAGSFTVTAIGGAPVVLHGHITPHGTAPAAADVDTYQVTVGGPTVLQVSVAGIGGLQGGFVVVDGDALGAADPLASYRRVGIDLVGSTATRQLVLPTAGTYDFAITDARTIALPGGHAYGDASSEYYVSITQIALPPAVPVTPSASGTALVIASGQLGVFSAPFGSGIDEVAVTTNDPDLAPALELYAGPLTYRTSAAGSLLAVGFTQGELATIVVDPERDFAPDPATITLAIRAGQATALSTSGATVTAPIGATAPPAGPTGFAGMTVLTYEVAAAGDVLALHLALGRASEGLVVDENLAVLTRLTKFDGRTFTAFDGYLLHAHPGTYYVLLDVPGAVVGTDTLTATSSLALAAPTALVTGTASAPAPTGGFDSALFSYAVDRAAHPWIAFAATTTGGGAGAVTARAYDTTKTFGRLSPVHTSGGTVTLPNAEPVLVRTLAAQPGAGRITLDDTGSWLLTVGPATVAAGTKESVTVSDRAGVTLVPPDLSGPGSAAERHGETLAPGATNLYLVRGDAGSTIAALATPAGTAHVSLAALSPDEVADVTFADPPTSTTPVGGPLDSHATGWIALAVKAVAPTTTGTYDLAVTEGAPATYAVSRPAAAFVDICTGGNAVTTVSDGTGVGDDEGLAAPLPVPAGFRYYGAAVQRFTISTNGWLSFEPQTLAVPRNRPIPEPLAPNQLVAPFWTDLAAVQICLAQTATRTTVEWVAVDRVTDAFVVFQATLDATDDSITFAYDPANLEERGTTATVGIEDLGASAASLQVSFDAGTLDPALAIVFSPR